MVNRIRFNGAEYNSLDEMPTAVRLAYEKALELAKQGKSGGLLGGHVNVKLTTKVRFAYNGKVYDSPEQMPPDVREKYDLAMQRIDKDHNGIPDALESSASLPASDFTPPSPDAFPTTEQSTPLLAPAQPVIAPESSNTRALLVTAGIVILILLVAVAVLLAILLRH